MNFQELGLILKREREARGLSIEAVMEATKISHVNLVALEAGDSSAMPHPVYTKGFVKSYARLLDLDAEELSMIVDQEYQTDETDRDTIVVYEVSPSAEKAFHEADAPPKTRSVWPSILLGVIAISLVLALLFFLNMKDEKSADSGLESPVVTEQPVVEDAPVVEEMPAVEGAEEAPASEAAPVREGEPVEEESSSPAAVPEASVTSQTQADPVAESDAQVDAELAEQGKYAHVLVIRAISDKGCWIGVWKGDETRMSSDFVLTKGEPLRLMFNSARRIRIGNVAGVTITYNGKPYPITDARGNIKTLRFGSAN
ncbi:helix-turn-helix domain-containing protein [Pseudodesulfovibrio sediminis]|uniref:Cytoskeleton protein RodZ-like C-terminal domain-containing protein n=1 Tax=Pseudodesulfovibrio sediminis TaxID=2810563 RepID=A0ABM7P2K4_9BACT|nr:RodZ domain-containing protein [Pseudodesulfovibrio sediminis]BCS87058.1 hypothetical protein PSDVSF_03000 [Pseudodesulfovibrio sediminis]